MSIKHDVVKYYNGVIDLNGRIKFLIKGMMMLSWLSNFTYVPVDVLHPCSLFQKLSSGFVKR